MKIVNAEKKLIDKLVEESRENIHGKELIYNATLNNYEKVCSSCAIYIVLLFMLLEIRINISTAVIYFH